MEIKDLDMEKTMMFKYGDMLDMEDLDGRRLYINSGIDDAVIDTIVYSLLRFNREDKGKPVEDRIPIKLYINSGGGYVTSGYGLIDAILASETPVYTINQSLCASMAFLIFIAGSKRYSMEHSQFLLHDGGGAMADSSAKLRDYMDFETDCLEPMTKDYVLKHSFIDSDVYDKNYRKEWWMLPNEAKENGFVDRIIGTDGCTIDEII